MKTSVLILAAGRNWRGWTDRGPKQLALVEGEQLILRTIRQLKGHRYDKEVVVVTHNKAVQAAVPRYFEPAKYYWRWETLISTQVLWAERTIILHGDTIFSPEAMDAIVAIQEPFMFIGCGNTLYAEAYVFTDHDLVLKAANAAIDAAYKGQAGTQPAEVTQTQPYQWGHQYGHWWFYYTLANRSPKLAKCYDEKIHLRMEGDYTFDIDTPKTYKKIISRMRI